MKKLLISFTLILIIVSGILLAQNDNKITINDHWLKVEEFADKQLPESALKELDIILKQAGKEKNSVEIIKAFIYKMRFTFDKNPDKATDLISELESFTSKFEKPAEKAVLQSMTAELYAKYYQYNLWVINQRTPLSGYIPDDISEWSKNIFLDKISLLLKASLENSEVQKQTNTLKFDLILNQGEDSRIMQPTLFDFLSYRKIEILTSLLNNASDYNSNVISTKNKNENDSLTVLNTQKATLSYEDQILLTYRKLIAFRQKENNIPALVYAQLQQLEFLHLRVEDNISDEKYLEELDKLENKYAGNESVVEVLAEKANYFLQKSSSEEEINDYKKTAFDICSKGIQEYPNYSRIEILKNIQKVITQKVLNLSNKSLVKSNSELSLKISSSNISKITVSVNRVNSTALNYLQFTQNKHRNKKNYPDRKLVESYEFDIKPLKKYTNTDTTFIIKSHEYGIYEIDVEEKGNTNSDEVATSHFIVSDLGIISRQTNEKKQSIYVLNRATGEQISDVNVSIYIPEWNENLYNFKLITQNTTNKKGYTELNNGSSYYNSKVLLEKGNDKYFISQNSVNYWGSFTSNKEEPAQLSLITDRKIYRPGQTVYFKGIAYFADKTRNEVIKSASYEVDLYDANNKKINSKKFRTNEFGSFAGEFVLPDNGLNGSFRIKSGQFSEYISVEEYKRPTFEVKIDKPKSEVRFNDVVNITGNAKAYAGYNIADSKVKYTVIKRTFRYRWWYFEPDKIIKSGTTTTDSSGNFNFDFVPERSSKNDFSGRGQFYTYFIYADVTDQKGETQKGENNISVGDKSLFIVTDLPDKFEKQKEAKISVYTETLNGAKVNSIVHYDVLRINETTEYIENISNLNNSEFTYKEAKSVNKGIFNTDNKTLELKIKNWKSGLYKIIFKTKDDRGNDVIKENVFIVYSKKDKRPPVKSYVWLQTNNIECEVGEKAQISFGTSTINTPVLFEVMQGNTVLVSKWLKFNNNIKKLEIPFKADYGDGVSVQFTFMKDEQLFNRKIEIKRKTVSKKLQPVLSVFRDKLKPGENAEWVITIPELKSKKVPAELLVDMYDASLDAFQKHYWYFNPVYSPIVITAPAWRMSFNYDNYSNVNFISDQTPVKNYQFDNLNWFGLDLGNRRYGRPIMIRGAKSTGMQLNIVEDELVFESDLDIKSNSELNKNVQTPPPPPPGVLNEINVVSVEKPIQIRENFNETAFFYPQLKTDSSGSVKLLFTVPESLTRWNVKILAHTQDLYFGQNETQVVTQKDLMVQMNLPRFVRQSDKLILSSNVTNLSEQELSATVQYELTDPETEKLILQNHVLKQTITLKPNESKVVEQEISDFSGKNLLICKVIARTENFSDGEQKYLPVLSDRMLVTESLPMTMRGNQTRTFNFENLIKNAGNVETQNLSLEFAANPAWYAVQALPTLSVPQNNNAIDYFTAYYANTLASYIANANPKIATTFERWKNAGGSKDALLSNLEKNKELKNMLLEETPWIMAAKDETEQKRQIALLFDLNMQRNQSEQYLTKLLSLQTPVGGFTWYPGMPESRYITLEIMLNMGRLRKMTNDSVFNNHKTEFTNALIYLDNELAKDFDRLKRYNKNYNKQNCIENIQLFYLHMRSEYPEIPIVESAKEAFNFYTLQAEKYSLSFTIYGKAMMAIVANRNGKQQLAKELLKSMKENALKSDESGMYWAKNKSGYFWNERPIAVQAAMIEAFSEISGNQSDINEMKIWLLKQKQTQRWDTPTSTVDAIYALLNIGSNWLADNGKVNIQVGTYQVTPASTEAGTGYFKQSIPVSNISPESGKITVSTTNSGISWGAMYWQYYQTIENITEQGGSLKITKKLFVEKSTSSGKSLIPIEQTKVVKGDKIITRLVISTDRNMEYVALKDLRAACFEPVDQLSGTEWKENLCYYKTSKDASTQYFFSFLPKGTYVFEYELWANNSGEFTNGIASIQCMYAPEFVSHTGGTKVVISK